MQRRVFLATIATIPVLPRVARAQVSTYCVNCSDLVEQLASIGKQAAAYALQAQQYVTELQQYANMVTNTVALPTQAFAQVQQDIMQVRNLANAASVLSGNAGGIMQRLNSAGAYANQAAYMPQNIGNQFTMWQQTFGNASSSLGRTLGVQQKQLQDATAVQAAIQAHSTTAAGQMQAIQAGVEMGGLTNYTLNQMQTTLVAMAQETATKDMIAAERQAMGDQEALTFFAPVPPAANWGVRY
jgi:P-type conjugative transfer protein TrbJ